MAVRRDALRNRLKRYERTGGKTFFKFKEGKNFIRILPFQHDLTRYDYLFGRCSEDEIGETVEDFFVDGYRYFRGKRFTNCLPDEDQCPIWQEYWSRPPDQRRDFRPRPFFTVQIVDMMERHKGVQTVDLSSSVFLGERYTAGKKVGIGIWDYFDGYVPEGGETAEEIDDELADEVEGGTGQSGKSLRTIQAFGSELLGLRGRDVIVVMKETKIGNKPVLVVNNDLEHGGILVRKKENCEILDDYFLKDIKDLYAMPQYAPGYDNTGKHITKAVGEFTSDYEERLKSKTSNDTETYESAGSGEPANDLDDEVDKTTVDKPTKKKTAKKKKKKTTRKRKSTKLENGASVTITDKWNEDNTALLPEAEWTRWKGVFDSYKTDEKGNTLARVIMLPEHQEEDELRDQLQEHIDGLSDEARKAGGPYFDWAVDVVELDQEEE